MSTTIHKLKTPKSELVVTRWCASADDGKDRIRVQLGILSNLNYSTISLSRKEWAAMQWNIDRAFAEFPEN